MNALKKLNLFESDSTDVEIVRRERIATRLYIGLLSLSMIGIILYATFSKRTIMITVLQPPEQLFHSLDAHYSDTLRCPCSRVSIQYSEFVQSQVAFHEVCGSSFITQEWIDAIYAANVSFVSPTDIRTTSSAFWQLVRSFCSLSNNSLVDVEADINATLLLTPTVQSPHLIETKVETSRKFCFTSAVTSLQLNMRIAREMTLGNGLLSGLGTNAYFHTTDQDSRQVVISPLILDNGCSCTNFDGCLRPAVYFGIAVPGIMFDCLPLDGMLASSLECFYEPTCLSLIQQLSSNASEPPSLANPSRFALNETLKTMILELMIEKWTISVLFSRYYARCSPTYCIYSYTRRFNIIYTVTLATSTFGGVSLLLRLMAPSLIKLVFSIYAWRQRRSSVNVGVADRPPKNLLTRLRSLLATCRNGFLKMNLFKTKSRDQAVVYRQRIVTRLFLICLGSSLLVLSLHAFLSTQTHTISVPYPSSEVFDLLQKTYPDTLRCPCSHISMPYSDFMSVVPTFHSLCSSQFTSPAWYDRLSAIDAVVTEGGSVFQRAMGASYFRLLATFCALSNQTLINAYRLFSEDVFVNDRALPKTIFAAQTAVVADAFNRSTKATFSRVFDLARLTSQANQLASRTWSNFNFRYTADGRISFRDKILSYFYPGFNLNFVGYCFCINEMSRCGYSAFASNLSFEYGSVPLAGLVVRCLPTESVLTSTLQCWYDRSCYLSILVTYVGMGIPEMIDNGPLEDGQSRFSENASMESMMSELLIERCIIDFSYERFYQGCAPMSCTYTVERRFDWFYVILVIISVYGALSKGLQLILPAIIRLALLGWTKVRSFKRSPNRNADVGLCARQISLISRIRQYVLTYNRFELPSSTADTRRRELLSTRLYVVLLTVCTIILLCYAGLVEQSKSETVHRPSQSTYEHLQSLDIDLLQCPCSSIAMPYADFIIYLNASLHPVCSSDFVSDVWRNFINQFRTGNVLWVQTADFRKWGIVLFNLLQSLCALSNATVADLIKQLQMSSFISSEALTLSQFHAQVSEALQSLQKSVSTLFARSLQLFRASDQGNALISILNNNWQLQYGRNTSNAPLLLVPMTYANGACSCATSSACVEPAAFYNLTLHKVYTLQGIMFGCSSLEFILRSSLACFFSNSCLVELEYSMALGNPSGYGFPPRGHISPMEFSSVPSRFQADDTIETIVNEMFIDSWWNETSYEQYYNACAPTYCSYSQKIGVDVIRALTTFLGVFNGLSIALDFVVPLLVKLGYKLRNRFTIQPIPRS